MNKKDYKGYEIIKAIHDGGIKDSTIIEVHDLSTVDHIKSKIEYSNKRLNWIAGEFDTTCLFDDNIYFRVLEDNTEEIEGLKYEETKLFDDNGNILETQYILRDEDVMKTINELVKAANKMMKEGKG